VNREKSPVVPWRWGKSCSSDSAWLAFRPRPFALQALKKKLVTFTEPRASGEGHIPFSSAVGESVPPVEVAITPKPLGTCSLLQGRLVPRSNATENVAFGHIAEKRKEGWGNRWKIP